MDHVQSNAAQTEELSSTAQSLSTQAHQLQVLVRRFKLREDDEKSSAFMSTAAHPMSVAPGAALVPEPRQIKKALSASPAGSHSGRHYALAVNGSAKHVDGGFEDF